MCRFALPHPAAPLRPVDWRSVDWDSIPVELKMADPVISILRGRLLWPPTEHRAEDRPEAERDLIQSALQCYELPSAVWTYDDHAWLFLRLAAEIEECCGVVAFGGDEPFSLWALRTVLEVTPVTLAHCLTHPDVAVRVVSMRYSARVSGALRGPKPVAGA
jgi:hypothetical protein